MSDQRVRDLERRWRQTGAVDDGAAWLAARLQAGQLEPERLAVAAYFGDASARRCAPTTARAGRGLGGVINGLAKLGWPKTDQAAFAATRVEGVFPTFWVGATVVAPAAIAWALGVDAPAFADRT